MKERAQLFENIPDELKVRHQWLVWRKEMIDVETSTKIPYEPRTGRKASVNNPLSWSNFPTVRDAAASNNGFDGIGFVLSDSDPYCVIDLDNKEHAPIGAEEQQRQIQILTAFRETYIERSQSKRGFHIVCKARIPKGVHRGSVEMYSNLRYMAFTGDILPQNIRPIIDCQQLVDSLYEKMNRGVVNPNSQLDESGEQILTDAEVCDMGLNAANGAKFQALGNGQWQELKFPSQSEADLSFISMLCFYTRNNDQVRRLFRLSMLGQRDKATANDVYINRTIAHCRANGSRSTEQELALAKAMGETLRKEALQKAEEASMPKAPPAPEAPREPLQRENYLKVLLPKFPPGLIGDIADYFLSTAHLPVPELALAASLCFVAGVAGRCFNISKSGLSLYLLYIAPTGSGKEGAARGINSLVASVKPQAPMIDEFIGPGNFASGQGMLRTLEDQPSFVSILGEFGLLLVEINDKRASSATKMIKRVMLDAFGKSGWNDRINATMYADVQKKIKTIYAPAMTILGETTPESFYENIGQADISDGFLPRFHIVEHMDKRAEDLNEMAGCAPSLALIQSVGNLVMQCLTMKANNANMEIAMDTHGRSALRDFQRECARNTNGAGNEAERQLWTRAHVKAIKLAGLLAVGVNTSQPCVDEFAAHWAIEYTRKGVQVIERRFFEGDIGQGENKQCADIVRLINEWFGLDAKGLRAYRMDISLQKAGFVPYNYLIERGTKLTSFYSDRMGASRAIKNRLNTLLESEVLCVLDANTALIKFNRRQKLYFTGPLWKK